MILLEVYAMEYAHCSAVFYFVMVLLVLIIMIMLIHWYLGNPGISPGMRPANERRRYNVTTSLIAWAHTWTDPYNLMIAEPCTYFLSCTYCVRTSLVQDPKVVSLFATNLSSILDVSFENGRYMFSHFRWWL